MTLRVVKMPSLADELDQLERRVKVQGEFEALPPDYPEARSGRTKFCPRCKRSRPVEFFNRHARTADRLFPQCRDCQAQAQRDARGHWTGYRAEGPA